MPIDRLATRAKALARLPDDVAWPVCDGLQKELANFLPMLSILYHHSPRLIAVIVNSII
jgi:hypothetical protein